MGTEPDMDIDMRQNPPKEWNKTQQTIIDYVENHLQREETPIKPDEIARMAGCSYSFFQKVFSYMNGISFAEYIRNRKMTLAGYELKSTNKKVIEISYQFGYDSPTSFTRAFQQFHGVSPKAARDSGVCLQVYPKMQVCKRRQYSWRICHMPSFLLIGVGIRLSKDQNPAVRIPEFWSECQSSGVFARLICLNEKSDRGPDETVKPDKMTEDGLFGLFGNYDENTGGMDYYITAQWKGGSLQEYQKSWGLETGHETGHGTGLGTGLEHLKESVPLVYQFREIQIPASSWAVFDCRGPVPQAIQEGWKYLNEEWLIKYPFRHGPCPELEWYSRGNSYGTDYLSQIWIPIVEE